MPLSNGITKLGQEIIITSANKKNVRLSDLSAEKWCLLYAAVFTRTPFQATEMNPTYPQPAIWTTFRRFALMKGNLQQECDHE